MTTETENWSGKRVLVVGLGRTGAAATRLLLAQGAPVIANDARSDIGPLADELREAGAELALGGHDEALFTSVDAIVVSPGVPPLPALDAAVARGIGVMSEIELASRFLSSTLIGITGTNGKSTVTTLVGEMCKRTGRPTFVGGNLGTPLIDVVGTPAAERGGYAVVELSSFQLERVERLRVDVAVLLNVSEDHLDRYPSFDAYATTKAAIFRRQTSDDFAVVPAGDALCERLAGTGAGHLRFYGGAEGAVRLEGGDIVDVDSGLRVPRADLPLRGAHNVANACAAALAARLGGVDANDIDAVLRSFEGLPHRMQHVRSLGGVRYFDDSKATNVGATVASLDGLATDAGKVVLIAGGRDKGGDYAPLATRMAAMGRAAVLIGEAADRIAEALQGCGIVIERAADMQRAVAIASALAQPGDSVLLAPACSSFDMFRSYVERGEAFQHAVMTFAGGGAA
jgi:UDP-N-acetylmuramoylalanine--D-glutamate ligase